MSSPGRGRLIHPFGMAAPQRADARLPRMDAACRIHHVPSGGFRVRNPGQGLCRRSRPGSRLRTARRRDASSSTPRTWLHTLARPLAIVTSGLRLRLSHGDPRSLRPRSSLGLAGPPRLRGPFPTRSFALHSSVASVGSPCRRRVRGRSPRMRRTTSARRADRGGGSIISRAVARCGSSREVMSLAALRPQSGFGLGGLCGTAVRRPRQMPWRPFAGLRWA